MLPSWHAFFCLGMHICAYATHPSMNHVDILNWSMLHSWPDQVHVTGNVATVKDTSGAGDAFNAGYLAGRLKGLEVEASVRKGQALAGDVIGHFGARLPKEATKAHAYDAN